MDRNSYYVDYYKRNVGRIKERSRLNYYAALKKKGIESKRKLSNTTGGCTPIKMSLINKTTILTFD